MLKSLSKLVKKAAPIALGYFAPGVGASMGLSPFMSGALASGLGAAISGQKPKDALLAGIMGGAAGSFRGAPTAATPESMLKPVYTGGGRGAGEFLRGAGNTTVAANPAFSDGIQKALTATPETFSAKLLEGLGGAGEGEGNLLFKLLNTQMGEGLAAGAAAQLLASMTEEEKEELRAGRDPFGYGYGGGQLGGINYADGGEAYFPRRNGGIDPSEGSGTKDDVPAMLMAGEFVMTRDAVKGMGDGDLRKGIGRMYDAMDNLERMA